ncbi:hypothetical protein HPB47_006279 [Ixodes persulcatus]|uniref:Uncharacterized protein n=1 Tax=Ixodes persulcatus TaxID=34615 RepID=A0AC60PAM2_IXOPE|nr:hypothetical protein HPB47_006279 [Ixodes persulcatus]
MLACRRTRVSSIWPVRRSAVVLALNTSPCRRNVASLSHLSARPEKGERSLPSSPYILNAGVDSLRALLLDALEGISFLTDQVAALRDENAQLRREHKHDAQQQATMLHNIQAELKSFRQEPRQGGKQPPSSYSAATSLQDPVDMMRDERGNTRPVTKATCASGAAVPAAIGGARSVASLLDSRMHSRHQDKLNLDGGGFRETRPKLPRMRRPLLKGSASASGIPVAPPPSQPRRQRDVFVTRLGPNCDAASLQAHIEQSGTLSSRERNQELVECIKRDCNGLKRPTIIMGDFNAHLEEFDGRTDHNGKLMLDMADHLNMVIANSESKCTGKTTWTARETSSTIDYCLMSPELYERLKYMEIDEEGNKSLGSDHNRLLIAFGAKPAEVKRGSTGRHSITQKEDQTTAEKLEAEAENKEIEAWNDIMHWWTHHLGKV